MFEDGARIDDIMNVLKRPTLDDEEEQKKIAAFPTRQFATIQKEPSATTTSKSNSRIKELLEGCK